MLHIFKHVVYFKQTELWFSIETALTVSEDPTESVPHNRLANLRKVTAYNS